MFKNTQQHKYMMRTHNCLTTLLATLLLSMAAPAQAQDATQLLGWENGVSPADKEAQQKPVHTIAVDFTPGFITSEVFIDRTKKRWELGMGYGVGYRCLFPSGYGFGMYYAHSNTDYAEVHGSYAPDLALKLDYVGPQFVMGSYDKNGAGLYLAMGLGYAHYKLYDKEASGVGLQFMVGADMRLADHLTFGIGLNSIPHMFSSDEDTPKDRTNGFARLGLNIGLRYNL